MRNNDGGNRQGKLVYFDKSPFRAGTVIKMRRKVLLHDASVKVKRMSSIQDLARETEKLVNERNRPFIESQRWQTRSLFQSFR